jgi:dCTP deaminase
VEDSKHSVLNHDEVLAYLARPLPDRLFISPLLSEAQVGATSIDLRIGHHFLIPDTSKAGILDVFEHILEEGWSQRDLYRQVNIRYGMGFNLHPGQSVLVGTLEYIGMPSDLVGYISGRSSPSRLPLITNTATIHPGFRGVITLTITSMAAEPVTLRPGMRVVQLQLQQVAAAKAQSRDMSRYDLAVGPTPSRLYEDSDLAFLGPSIEPMIVGVVSTIGAGRSTAIAHLRDHHGFRVFSLADAIRQEAVQRGRGTDRTVLQELGSSLRETRGDGYLASRLRSSHEWQTSRDPYVVVDSFKHTSEVNEFSRQRHFHLLAIDAPVNIRWQRVSQLRRSGYPSTFEEFQTFDEADRGVNYTQPHAQQVSRVIGEAKTTIINDGTLEDFYMKLDQMVQRFIYRRE